jgi:hypothetical protein
VIFNAIAVRLQIPTDIVPPDRWMTVRSNIRLVVTGCTFNVHEDGVEFEGVGGEPGCVRGREGFAAECTHIVSGPTEDDHLWDCFVEWGFRFGRTT